MLDGTTLLAVVLAVLGFLTLGIAWRLWHLGAIGTEQTESDLLYALTHDISNPLQSILATLANMSAYPFQDEERWRRDLSSIRTTISHLVAVTANIKALALLNSVDYLGQRSMVDMAGVVQRVIIASDSEAEKAGVRLTYQGDDFAPPIWGNSSDLERAVYNLIGNGIKFRNPNVNQSEVLVTVAEDQGKLTVTVDDNGLGMSRSRRRHALEARFQPRSVRTIGIEGTGLGLYLVKRTVEKYGGTVTLDSVLGQGTTVRMRFPIAQVEEADQA